MEEVDLTAITVFSKDNCKWCVLAKKLLKSKGVPFTEVKIPFKMSKEEFINLTEEYHTRPTVPKIFKGSELIGGYEDLVDYFENEEGSYGEGKI